MDIINHSDNPNLRDIDVMIAYLRDEVSLEKVEQIEKLMDEDELYELSMQELSKSLHNNTHILSDQIRQTQDEFPQLLALARDNFVAQLEQQQPQPQTSNKKSFPGNLPIWPFIIALLVIGGFMIWMLMPAKQGGLHQNPAQHLVLDGDLSIADAFMKACGDEKPGMGRGSRVSLYSALVENYSFKKYEQASRQFEELLKNPDWTDPCQAFLNFYQGKTLLALKEYTPAARLFQNVITSGSASPAVKNAAHWYMANIFLIQKDFAAANMHLKILTADENQDSSLHLAPLFEQNYLETAKKYYMDISAS